MKFASLFTGIGGFDIAAKWIGWDVMFQCEFNSFCQRVLKYYWPNTELYGDIKTTDFTIWSDRIDVLAGGPPCQPASVAGKRQGTTDDRWLWPEAFRAVREIKPKYIVFENPVGIVSLEGGKQFEWIFSTLENEGYTTEVYNIPACGLQAPHERQRIWFVAYSNSIRFEWDKKFKEGFESFGRGSTFSELNSFDGVQSITDSHEQGLQDRISTEFGSNKNQAKTHKGSKFTRKYTEKCWNKFPTQSPICSGNDGFSNRLVDITFPKWKNESIKALGNAVVPQIPYEIFKAIQITLNQII